MLPVKVGVIGAGYWGPNLIRNFHQIPGADLQFVCYTKQERLDHIQSLYPHIKVTQELDELLNSDIEAVVIATPVITHHPLAMQSLKAGKHILVEKPLANSSLLAREIVTAGEEAGKVVMTGHTFLLGRRSMRSTPTR